MVLRNAFFPHRIGGTGAWSSRGCELFSRNQSHIACQCNHITSFAVLMDISKREVGDGSQANDSWRLWFSRGLTQSLSFCVIQGIASRSVPVSGVCCPCLTNLLLGLLKGASYLLGAGSGCCPYTLNITHSCWPLNKSVCWLSSNENIGILSSRFDWRRRKGKPQEVLSSCLSTERGGASSEDRHLHNRVHLAGGFADHLHFAGPDPHATFQLAQYPQKPGGCPVLF